MIIFGVEIPMVRLIIAGVCVAVALLLLLIWLIYRIAQKMRYRGRYGKGFQPNPYTAQRKHPRSGRPQYGASSAAAARHSRPAHTRRRYGQGFHPDREPKHTADKAAKTRSSRQGGRRLR